MLSRGEPVVLWHVSLVCVEVEPTGPVRVRSATCAVEDVCSLPQRPGVAGTDASMSIRNVMQSALPSLLQESQHLLCQKVRNEIVSL